MNSHKSFDLPRFPKSIGLSRRLVIAIIILMLGVMLLFIVFLKHYASQQKPLHPVDQNMLADQEGARAQITKIMHAIHQPLLTHIHHPTTNTPHAITVFPLNNNKAFREGSSARISVYQAAAHADSTNIPALETSAATDPISSAATLQPPIINRYADPNGQSEKSAFLEAAQQHKEDRISSTLHSSHSPYAIYAGTIIPATLMTGIQSSLPGTMIAKVRRDVFDTATGRYLLIPQGTTLIGTYDARIAYGQSRVLIVWSRLIFPNGNSFDLQGMPGADLTGMAGLHDIVHHHYVRLFGSALLLSLFGAAGQLSQPVQHSDSLTTPQILSAAVGQQMNQTAMQLLQKNMNIQPTIRIRPGTGFNVLLTRDMVLPHAYRISF